MIAFPWTALIAIAGLLVYFWTFARSGRARLRYKVAAPAMTGPEPFMRAMRVHLNTLEQLPLFIVPLGLFAWAWGDGPAALVGLWWPLGRILYSLSYYADPARRGPGFLIALASALTLLFGALAAVVRTLLGLGL